MKGKGNSLDFGARMYDSRLGRWYALDGIVKPFLSSYQYGRGNPLIFIDPDGNTEYYYNGKHIASDNVNNGLIALVKNREVKKQISAGMMPNASGLRNGTNTNEMFVMHINILRASNTILAKSLTEPGKTKEFGTRLNSNGAGDYQMIPEGIVEGQKKTPEAKISEVTIPGIGGVTVHSHPTGEELNMAGNALSYDAADPGPADMDDIEAEEYTIIVGMDGRATSEVTTDTRTGYKTYSLYNRKATSMNVFDKDNRSKPAISIAGKAKAKVGERIAETTTNE